MPSRRSFARSALSSTLAASLAGAAQLVAPVARLSLTTRAQTAGETALPAGRLAYLLGGHLWVAAASGSDRRVATGTGGWIQDPAWSPDGTRIAYAHVRFPLSPPPGTIPWPASDIYAAAPDGAAEPALLVRRVSPNDTLVSPSWSPDGRFLYAILRRPLDAMGLSVAVELFRTDLLTGERLPLPVRGEPVEIVTAPDGALVVVTIEYGPGGSSLSRLLRLPPEDPTAAVELLNSDQGLGGFITLPRVSPSGQRILFAAGGDAPIASNNLLDTLLGGTAEAHGARGWPYVLDLTTGAVRRAPTEGHDDLVGLAWLDERRAVLLDAFGLGTLDMDDGTTLRVPRLTATGFAWLGGPISAPGA